MENAVALKEEVITQQDIKKYIAPNATDKELFMFMGICKSYGLNPLKREIHFVKYGTAAASIIVGYEIYLKRAERTGKLDGWNCHIEKDDIGEKAVIEIKRKDHSMPIKWEVYRKEFDKGQSTWKTMPTFMLKKVAIAQGFRLAFPDDLGGMPYIPEELPQTNENVTSEALDKKEVEVTAKKTKDDIPESLGTESEKAPQNETSQAGGGVLPSSQPEENIVFSVLKDITSKTGVAKSTGKEWKLYTIETQTGDKYGTFSDTVADYARTFITGGELVKIEYEMTTKGNKQIKTIEGT